MRRERETDLQQGFKHRGKESYGKLHGYSIWPSVKYRLKQVSDLYNRHWTRACVFSKLLISGVAGYLYFQATKAFLHLHCLNKQSQWEVGDSVNWFGLDRPGSQVYVVGNVIMLKEKLPNLWGGAEVASKTEQEGWGREHTGPLTVYAFPLSRDYFGLTVSSTPRVPGTAVKAYPQHLPHLHMQGVECFCWQWMYTEWIHTQQVGARG